MISMMSSVGRLMDVNTITMVTSPAWGMPGAPTLAVVAVMLREFRRKERTEDWKIGKGRAP